MMLARENVQEFKYSHTNYDSEGTYKRDVRGSLAQGAQGSAEG